MESSGPSRSATVSCPACGTPVDTLRAGHVAILDDGFRYFCDAECKRSYLQGAAVAMPSEVETREPPPVAMGFPAPKAVLDPAREPEPARPPEPAREPEPAHEPEPEQAEPAREPSSPAIEPEPAEEPLADDLGPSQPVSPPFLPPIVTSAGIVAGVFVPCLALLGPGAQAARLPLATAAFLACVLRALFVPRDPSDVHPFVAALSVGAVWGVAISARSVGDPRALGLADVAGLAAAGHLIGAVLVDRAREGVRSARAWIRARLDVPVDVVRGATTVRVRAAEVKAGEEITVRAGETLGVDVRVTSGEGTVTPWIDATIELPKKEGDPIVAGARVVSGSLTALATWSAGDRAWLRLVDSPTLRPDVVGPLARAVRLSIERGVVPLVAFVATLAALNGATGLDLVAISAVTGFCVAGTWAAGIVALHQARGPMSALAYGAVYRDAAAFDRAGQTEVAILSARTTLLLGSPEIVALEAIGTGEASRVLRLAAGASATSPHPASGPVLEAARTRGQLPESLRHASYHAGLGVTALAASGERVVVGSRGLLLREKVSVAAADARVSQLEGEGRSVMLVALAGKLVGLLALQDGLRPGARAAVQRLLDAHIEPVLLSGEARDTCETIGRALDIEHIRPEILPEDAGPEVRALADAGRRVAVLGDPVADGPALGAAEVSVALGAAGAPSGDWTIALASEDVRDAARALTIAAACRDRTRWAIAIGLVPGAVVALGIALGLVPLALGPIVAVAGVAAAVVQARR